MGAMSAGILAFSFVILPICSLIPFNFRIARPDGFEIYRLIKKHKLDVHHVIIVVKEVLLFGIKYVMLGMRTTDE
jgi:hypothetical protein